MFDSLFLPTRSRFQNIALIGFACREGCVCVAGKRSDGETKPALPFLGIFLAALLHVEDIEDLNSFQPTLSEMKRTQSSEE